MKGNRGWKMTGRFVAIKVFFLRIIKKREIGKSGYNIFWILYITSIVKRDKSFPKLLIFHLFKNLMSRVDIKF